MPHLFSHHMISSLFVISDHLQHQIKQKWIEESGSRVTKRDALEQIYFYF